MFDFLVNFFGTIVTLIFFLYLILLALRQNRGKNFPSSPPLIKMDNMPVLRPIPMPTANQKGLLDKVLVFVFQVRHWRVEEAFTYEYKGKRYAVHAGFEFDGASIPKPLWALLSPVGLLLIPSLIHDYGYRYNGIYILDENNKAVWDETISTQLAWDQLFKDIGNDVNRITLLNELAKFGLWIGGFKTWKTWRVKKEDKVPFKWTVNDKQQANNEHQQDSEDNVNDYVEDNVKDNVKDNQATSDTEVSSEKLVSGKTKTTQIGYENSNNQKVLGSRNLDKTDNKKVTYKMACGHCGEIYGAKTAEIHRRKCPACQDGKPSMSW